MQRENLAGTLKRIRTVTSRRHFRQASLLLALLSVVWVAAIERTALTHAGTACQRPSGDGGALRLPLPPDGAGALNVTVPVAALPPNTLVGLSVTPDKVTPAVAAS